VEKHVWQQELTLKKTQDEEEKMWRAFRASVENVQDKIPSEISHSLLNAASPQDIFLPVQNALIHLRNEERSAVEAKEAAGDHLQALEAAKEAKTQELARTEASVAEAKSRAAAELGRLESRDERADEAIKAARTFLNAHYESKKEGEDLAALKARAEESEAKVLEAEEDGERMLREKGKLVQEFVSVGQDFLSRRRQEVNDLYKRALERQREAEERIRQTLKEVKAFCKELEVVKEWVDEQ